MFNFVPYKLKQGILLSELGIVIPWRNSKNNFHTLANVSINEMKSVTFYSWNNQLIFDDLLVNIQARSDSMNIFTIFPIFEDEHTAMEQFNIVLSSLVQKLGEPKVLTKESNYFPVARWIYNDIYVGISVHERFGEYLSFKVQCS